MPGRVVAKVIVAGNPSAYMHCIPSVRPHAEPGRRPSSRSATAMSARFLTALGIATLLVSRILGVTAQGTGAVCQSGFEWMTNSKGQSPCLVSSWLFTPCSTPSDSYVQPLPSGFHYATPLNTTESANPCRCNTVLFSTIAACATCQGGQDYIVPWFLYSENCSTIYIQKYPENIPSGTSIPAWAYLDVRVNNTFDPAAAQAVAAQNLPESSALPAPSTTSQPSMNTSLASTTDRTTSSPTATGGGSNSDSESKKKSNAGPISGGVVGGLGGLALISLTIFFIFKYRSRRNAALGDDPVYTNYGADTQTWEKSPVTSVSTHRIYDPDDPRTFPTQGPYASGPVQATTGYLSADASAAVVTSNFADRYRAGGVTTQNSYRGAPEF